MLESSKGRHRSSIERAADSVAQKHLGVYEFPSDTSQLKATTLATVCKALRNNSSSRAVARTVSAKLRVVLRDEREREGGRRTALNYGHTLGHAIEAASAYRAVLHGEAVAIGLVAAAHLSQHLGFIDSSLLQRVERILAAHALPTRLRAPLPLADLRSAMSRDKKVRAGGLRFVVLRALGEAATQGNIPPELADASFRVVGAV